jgi:hypothetical protein
MSEESRRGAAGSDSRDKDAAVFAESLKRRGEAARGLQEDLLHEVPLLYGSAGRAHPHGDPGVVLAKLHREQMVGRNGGGIPEASEGRSHALLPFERTIMVLVILILLVQFSGVLR